MQLCFEFPIAVDAKARSAVNHHMTRLKLFHILINSVSRRSGWSNDKNFRKPVCSDDRFNFRMLK
ncbi:hypothetical protein D3C73_916540 [compost metagenome]